jgi:predicted RNA binding protein YcfA (HicA-like mRNA interferase family)
MTISGKEMLKKFLKAGWTVERIKGSHHFVTKGDAFDTIPVHSKDIGKGLERKLLKKLEETK